MCEVGEDLCDYLEAKTPVDARSHFLQRIVAGLLMPGAILGRDVMARAGTIRNMKSTLANIKSLMKRESQSYHAHVTIINLFSSLNSSLTLYWRKQEEGKRPICTCQERR